MRMRFNGVTATNMGVGILLNISVSPKYKDAVDMLVTSFNATNEYEIKPYKEKRSLSANAYCWVLIEKIAEKMNKPKEEVYIEMLKDYGTIAVDSEGKKLIFSVKASIDISKYFKYYKEMGLSKDGNFKHYYVIKGSSEYDSKEMNRFIDGIIQECKSLGIETMTPEEIARLEVGNE